MFGPISGWIRGAVVLLMAVWSASILAQGIPTQSRHVMQQKLEESQQLLSALVTSNWAALDRHGRALKALTSDPGWDRLRLPEYQKQTMAFVQATDTVIEAAARRDQREALAAYNGLVASCVECHRYIARARVVKTY